LTGHAARAFECFLSVQQCYGTSLPGDIGFGDLFLYHKKHFVQEIEPGAGYSVPIFTYFDDDPSLFPFGYADDNYADATQSFVYSGSNPAVASFGIGLTETVLHEVGHHFGLSHPIDGYDSQSNRHYQPRDFFFFAWIGRESATTMGSMLRGLGFSQFDHDNMDRYLTASYINQANAILNQIARSSRADETGELLSEADADAAVALADHEAMDYRSAGILSKRAYDRVLEAAESINVHIEPEAWPADYASHGSDPYFVDRVQLQPSR
jgi:hypothetical protein